MTERDKPHEPAGSRFDTTQWSLVLAAGEPGSPSAQEALAALCRIYWLPIYVYLRRRGESEDRARDLTQGFFAKLLEKNYVGDFDRERGRFRAFLLASLKHYVANQRDRETAQKRGGGQTTISIDELDAESRYKREPGHEETPERLFERRWARTVLEASIDRLREETTDARARERFHTLVPFMTGVGESGYRRAAETLGISETAARVAVHRMRRRFRKIMREEVARTVDRPGQVEDELRFLFKALAR